MPSGLSEVVCASGSEEVGRAGGAGARWRRPSDTHTPPTTHTRESDTGVYRGGRSSDISIGVCVASVIVLARGGSESCCIKLAYKGGVQRWCTKVVYRGGIQRWHTDLVYEAGIQRCCTKVG